MSGPLRGLLAVWGLDGALSCSNLLVPGGSSADGSTIITYSTDNPNRFGDIAHWPKGKHAETDLRQIFDFDSGVYLGAIPQTRETYNVVSNTNEHQLSIGETTFGGLKQLDGSIGGPDFGPGHVKPVCHERYGCVDYGSMIYLVLQRAKTAQEAITVIDDLMQTYGYASSGESFSIADTTEVWLMDIIGKGNISKGAVWVATKIPSGYVSAHANQARTRTFNWHDPENVRYAKDVASFARSIGVYEGSDIDFSFSDVYDPVTFEGARFCEARVYSFFQKVAAPEVNIEQYTDYIQGYNLTNRMPLYVKAKGKLSVNETMWHMRNHYEDTVLDPRNDVGAGEWRSPYRLGEGMTWKYKGVEYVNERKIGTHKAAMNIVANGRPAHRFGVLWYGVDDSTFSLHTPLYGVTSRLPKAWDGGNCTGRAACREAFGLPGSMTKFSLQTMHWVGQMVANYAYSRYDIIAPEVFSKLAEIEEESFKKVSAMDVRLNLLDDAAAAERLASDFSYETAQDLHLRWLDFYGELFATFVDGYRMVPDPSSVFSGCKKEALPVNEDWQRRVVEDTGDHYRKPAQLSAPRHATISKLSLAALGGIPRQSLERAQPDGSAAVSLV